MATIKDVAKMAGVSISTVSLAFNSPERVSEKTREKIFSVSRSLNYVSVQKKRKATLRKEKSEAIVVMCPKLIGPYFFEILRGISETIYMNKKEMVLYFGDDILGKHFMEVVENRGYQGAILVNVPIHEEKYLQAAIETDFPTILCSFANGYRGLSSVIIDNEGIGRMVADHFIKRKFDRVGLVGLGVADSEIRREAFVTTLEKSGIELLNQWVLPCELAEEPAYRIVYKSLLEKEEIPKAIFCLNDECAIGTIEAIHKYGLKVPEDISVIGCDDANRSKYYTPSLSTVAIPKLEMGIMAVNMLMRRIIGLPAEEIVLNGKLILRDSCQ